MKALLVREELDFERGGNPLRQMDIGLMGWDEIKPGTMVQCIKNVATDQDDNNKKEFIDFDAPVNAGIDYWGKGYYGVVKHILDYKDDTLNIEFIPQENFADAKDMIRKVEMNAISLNIFSTIVGVASIGTWMKYFKIIQPRDL